MTTTTAPAPTARSITTAVRRAIRLAGRLDSVIKASTTQARTSLFGEITNHWSTTVEVTSREQAEQITAVLGASYPVVLVRAGMNFAAVEIAQPIATPVAENSEANTSPKVGTARTVTNAVRKALRLAGKLDHARGVSTTERNTSPVDGVQTPVWSTVIEIRPVVDARVVGRILAAAGFTVTTVVTGGSPSFVRVTTPIGTEPAAPVAEENHEGNSHEVRYVNVNGHGGTVLIEHGTTRRADAVDQAARIHRSGGHVFGIVEITSRGLRVAVEGAVPAAEGVAVTDYWGDDEALALDLRITEHNMTKADRSYALCSVDRRHRVHLLRVQAARARLVAPAAGLPRG